MMKLHGVISDRVRKLFAPGDPAYSPQRPDTTTKPMKIKKGVEGQSLGGRKKK